MATRVTEDELTAVSESVAEVRQDLTDFKRTPIRSTERTFCALDGAADGRAPVSGHSSKTLASDVYGLNITHRHINERRIAVACRAVTAVAAHSLLIVTAGCNIDY